MHVFLLIRVEISMVVTQKSDVMKKNGRQIRTQRQKYTQVQIKKFLIQKKKFFLFSSVIYPGIFHLRSHGLRLELELEFGLSLDLNKNQ